MMYKADSSCAYIMNTKELQLLRIISVKAAVLYSLILSISFATGSTWDFDK